MFNSEMARSKEDDRRLKAMGNDQWAMSRRQKVKGRKAKGERQVKEGRPMTDNRQPTTDEPHAITNDWVLSLAIGTKFVPILLVQKILQTCGF